MITYIEFKLLISDYFKIRIRHLTLERWQTGNFPTQELLVSIDSKL